MNVMIEILAKFASLKCGFENTSGNNSCHMHVNLQRVENANVSCPDSLPKISDTEVPT